MRDGEDPVSGIDGVKGEAKGAMSPPAHPCAKNRHGQGTHFCCYSNQTMGPLALGESYFAPAALSRRSISWYRDLSSGESGTV